MKASLPILREALARNPWWVREKEGTFVRKGEKAKVFERQHYDFRKLDMLIAKHGGAPAFGCFSEWVETLVGCPWESMDAEDALDGSDVDESTVLAGTSAIQSRKCQERIDLRRLM